jgi:hypothetical protein
VKQREYREREKNITEPVRPDNEDVSEHML